MKKIGLLAALLLVAVAVGASIMTGRLFNQELVRMTDQVLQDPRLELVSMDLDSGLFRSSGVQQFAVVLDAESRLLIEGRWQATHFPGWLTYDGDLSFMVDDGSGELFNLLEELGVAAPTYQGSANWRKLNYTLTLEPFGYEDLGLTVTSSGVQMEGVYHYSSGRQLASLVSDSLTFESEDLKGSYLLDVQGIRVQLDQLGNYPWGSGEMELTLDQVDFDGPQAQVSVSKPSWLQTLSFDERAFDLSLKLDLGDITAMGQPLAKGHLALKTRDFNGQVVAELIEFIGRFPDFHQIPPEEMQQAMVLMDRLLDGSPALVIDTLDFSVQQPFPLEQKAWGELSFDGQNLPTPYLQQLEAGSLDPEDPINRLRLEVNIEQLHLGLMMMLGIPPAFVDASLPHQTFLMENGAFYLNGNPLPF